MEQWEEKENREFFRAGTIAAAAINPYRDVSQYPKGLTAYDIFPHLPEPPVVLPTPEEAKRNAERFFGTVEKLKERGHLRRVRPRRSA